MWTRPLGSRPASVRGANLYDRAGGAAQMRVVATRRCLLAVVGLPARKRSTEARYLPAWPHHIGVTPSAAGCLLGGIWSSAAMQYKRLPATRHRGGPCHSHPCGGHAQPTVRHPLRSRLVRRRRLLGLVGRVWPTSTTLDRSTRASAVSTLRPMPLRADTQAAAGVGCDESSQRPNSAFTFY